MTGNGQVKENREPLLIHVLSKNAIRSPTDHNPAVGTDGFCILSLQKEQATSPPARLRWGANTLPVITTRSLTCTTRSEHGRVGGGEPV